MTHESAIPLAPNEHIVDKIASVSIGEDLFEATVTNRRVIFSKGESVAYDFLLHQISGIKWERIQWTDWGAVGICVFGLLLLYIGAQQGSSSGMILLGGLLVGVALIMGFYKHSEYLAIHTAGYHLSVKGAKDDLNRLMNSIRGVIPKSTGAEPQALTAQSIPPTAGAKINCPRCGRLVRSGDIFCSSCGEKVIEKEKPLKFKVKTGGNK
jgi:DNA-directed RNA polymerase subunit RPC12/RpoP